MFVPIPKVPFSDASPLKESYTDLVSKYSRQTKQTTFWTRAVWIDEADSFSFQCVYILSFYSHVYLLNTWYNERLLHSLLFRFSLFRCNMLQCRQIYYPCAVPSGYPNKCNFRAALFKAEIQADKGKQVFTSLILAYITKALVYE